MCGENASEDLARVIQILTYSELGCRCLSLYPPIYKNLKSNTHFQTSYFYGKKNLSFISKDEQNITLLIKEPAEGSDSYKNQWASN